MRISDWSSDVCSSDLAAGVQARDLVLVLVGHELEEVAVHGFGEVGRAGRLRLLGGAHLRHEVGVALRVRRVLVVDEEGGAAGDQFVERARQARVVQRQEGDRSEEHTSELQSLMRISYAVFCLKKKTNPTNLHIVEDH